MMKKDCIAMILAGGSGTRLKPLTKKLAKPAVAFGGKYRIIDFCLSNCVNSRIDTMGIMVQYKPLFLNAYLNSFRMWRKEAQNCSVTILSPQMNDFGGQWYNGTADAVYKNMEYIDMHDAENIIILSADQIYKMDYSKMLDFHIETKADVTVASTKVSMTDASRFGILEINKKHKVVGFEEKPDYPKSNLASMGIYIFKKEVLKKYLEEDHNDKSSSHDFGKNILPNIIQNGLRLHTYVFEGYWRDVGTIKSFWEAHMDLLEEQSELELYDSSWPIYHDVPVYPPLYVSRNAQLSASIVGEGCVIKGNIENSVLFPGVRIGENAIIKDSVVMSGAVIEDNAVVERAIIGSDALIHENCYVKPMKQNSENVVIVDEAVVIDSDGQGFIAC